MHLQRLLPRLASWSLWDPNTRPLTLCKEVKLTLIYTKIVQSKQKKLMTTGREVVRLITNMATAILVFYQNCIICIMICIRARNKWEKHIALSKMLMKCLNIKVNISLQWFYRLNNKEKEREREKEIKKAHFYIYWIDFEILPIYFWTISVSIYITSLIRIENYIYITPIILCPICH